MEKYRVPSLAPAVSLLIYVLNRWPKPETEPTAGPKSKPEPMPAELGPKSSSIFLRQLHGCYRAWNRLETETYNEAQLYPSAPDSALALRKEFQKEFPDLMILQAIIHQMLGSIYEARRHWQESIVVRDPAFRREIDFEQFKRHVERLRQANSRQNGEI